MLNKSALFDYLKYLDINLGDFLFVRASLKELGSTEGSYSDFLTWILEYLGPSGTPCALSFTPYAKNPEASVTNVKKEIVILLFNDIGLRAPRLPVIRRRSDLK